MVTRLLEGHARLRRDVTRERELFDALAKGRQEPTALVIGCCDSRVVPNLIVQAGPGELFVVRNIANIVPRFDGALMNRSVGASIEYAVHVLRVPHIVICGHTQCGGLTALVDGPEALTAEMPTLAAWLRDASAVLGRLTASDHGKTREQLIRQLVFENVVVQLENLLTYPVVERAVKEGRLELHGWVYDLADGSLRMYDAKANAFHPVDMALRAAAAE